MSIQIFLIAAIDRTPRAVALTQVGREFLPTVERVLGEIDAVVVNAHDVAGRRRGLVTIAALPSVASTLRDWQSDEARTRASRVDADALPTR